MFLVLVVLYQKDVNSSATLQGLLRSSDVLNSTGSSIIVWDNSPVILNSQSVNKLKTSFTNFQYIHTPDNLYLSKIYNKSIEKGLEIPGVKYLVLLDDDSHIDQHYFTKAIEATAHNHELILPVIKNHGVIRSPMKYYIIKSFFFKELKEGLLPSKNLMAINSGMLISFDFIRRVNFRYDTRLRNYGTDNFLMKVYSSVADKVYILDYVINHSLSFFDSPDINKRLQVFRENKKTILQLHADNTKELILARLYNILSSLKNAIKYKKLAFLK